jgi:hypothetical protein
VLDAVARGLVHGQQQVDLGVPGQGERRQPTADLRAEGGELAGTRRPGPMRELRSFNPVDRGYRFGDTVPPGCFIALVRESRRRVLGNVPG